MLGMEGKAALVLFARPGHDAKAQLVHGASFFRAGVGGRLTFKCHGECMVAVGSESGVELHVTLLGWRTVLPPVRDASREAISGPASMSSRS